MKKIMSMLLSVVMLFSITAGLDLSAYAAGNSINTATPISFNTSYSGNITSTNNSDFYKFTLNSSGKINLVLTAYIYEMNYYIYDSDGKIVWEKRYVYWNDNTKQSSIDEKIDLTKGTYYFAAVRNDGTGNYNFKITFTTASESFSETKGGINNSITTANSISLGKSYKGQIAINDNSDFYKFTLNSSGKINLVLTAYIYEMNYYIYDSDGKIIWEKRYVYWNDNTKQSSIDEKIDLTKGTYYFAAVQNDGTGNYSFSICSHKYDSGKVTKAATCKATGVKTYTCTVCKATKTETIAKKAHSYKNYVTKATTSKNGSIVNKCSMCGAKKSSSTIYKIKSVSLSTTATYYNGKVKTPGVTVKDSKNRTLKKGTDYTVSYESGRKNVGRYAVKVTFKGNYSGSKTLYFNIIPKNVSGIKKLTAGKKRFTVSWNPQKTQVTGYQIQYSTASNFKNAKTITMGKSSYSAKKVTGRMAKKRYYVRIRTYKTVKFNGKNYNIYSPWCAKKSVVTKK